MIAIPETTSIEFLRSLTPADVREILENRLTNANS